MKVAIMIHGMAVKDGGAGTIGKLHKYLREEYRHVTMFPYKYLSLIGTRRKNEDVAKRLANYIGNMHLEKGDELTLFCHSNGCTIAYLVSRFNVTRKLKDSGVKVNLVLINAALPREIKFSAWLNQIRIFHAQDDHVVKWAHYLRSFLELFGLESRWRPWGDMGKYGYRGPVDPRVRNIELTDILIPEQPIGHSGAFTQPAIKRLISKSIDKKHVRYNK